MNTLTTITHIDASGAIRLDLPNVPEIANVDVDVLVVLNPVATNGSASPTSTNGSDAAWRTHTDRFAGSMPDFPDIERPGPESYETRLPIE